MTTTLTRIIHRMDDAEGDIGTAVIVTVTVIVVTVGAMGMDITTITTIMDIGGIAVGRGIVAMGEAMGGERTWVW